MSTRYTSVPNFITPGAILTEKMERGGMLLVIPPGGGNMVYQLTSNRVEGQVGWELVGMCYE